MIDFKMLDEKYIIKYVDKPDIPDYTQELVLLKKKRDKYDDNHISVSEAYKIAAQKKKPFSASESFDIQCFIDAKTLNDHLGFESNFLTHYFTARATGRTEPFTKEITNIYKDENLKKLNVLFGFEKYNPDDNLFMENENPDNFHFQGPSNCMAEFEFQRRICRNLRFEIINQENSICNIDIVNGNENVAHCITVDEGNGTYLIEDLKFQIPELDSSKPYIEFYKIASARFLVSEILDFLCSTESCLTKSGLVSQIKMSLSHKDAVPLNPSNHNLNNLDSFDAVENLIKSIQMEETQKWFKSKHITLKTVEFYPDKLAFENKKSSHICRIARTKLEESDDRVSFELKFEKIPEVWTGKETELIMPKYFIQNSFYFPAYCSNTIAKGAFKNLKDFKFIYIPETVKKIEEGAFENCPKLKSVLVEDNVEYSNNAFVNCGGTKDFFAKTCLLYNFYNEQFSWDTGLASSLYIDISGETEKRFGKLLIIAASDTDWERVGIPFTVEENPRIAVGSDSDLENWREYFESNLEEKDLEDIKEFIRKNLDLLKAVSKLPQKNGRPDFEKSNEMLKKLVSVDGTGKKENSTEVLSQAEIDTLLDF